MTRLNILSFFLLAHQYDILHSSILFQLVYLSIQQVLLPTTFWHDKELLLHILIFFVKLLYWRYPQLEMCQQSLPLALDQLSWLSIMYPNLQLGKVILKVCQCHSRLLVDCQKLKCLIYTFGTRLTLGHCPA